MVVVRSLTKHMLTFKTVTLCCVRVCLCLCVYLCRYLHMFNNNNNSTKIQSQKCKLICKCKFHSRQLFVACAQAGRQTEADDDSKHACQVSINIALALPLWHTLLHSHPLSLSLSARSLLRCPLRVQCAKLRRRLLLFTCT